MKISEYGYIVMKIIGSTTQQSTITVEVAYYNKAEEAKLHTFTTAIEIGNLVSNGIVIPISEFLTYYLFHRKKTGKPQFQSIQAFSALIHKSQEELDGFVDFNGHSICTASGITNQKKNITEYIGEAIGLSVVSRIHDLHDADWCSIEEGPNSPTFDYQIASDGIRIIQVETKGSSISNNRKKEGSISKHKTNILSKKQKLKSLAKQNKDPFPAHLRYGTITAIDPNQNGTVKCWLTDPLPKQQSESPRDFRLLVRMRFIRDWISFISRRSQLAAALTTRVLDLENLYNPFELHNLPLIRVGGEKFNFEPYYKRIQNWQLPLGNFHVVGGEAGGVVNMVDSHTLIFFGVHQKLLELATNQNFEDILNYRLQSRTEAVELSCAFTELQFKKLNLFESISKETEKRGDYFVLKLIGRIHYSQGGLVHGMISIPENRTNDHPE